MAKAAASSFKEFRTRYQTAEACREELFRQPFPKGARVSEDADAKSFMPFAAGTSVSAVSDSSRPPSPPEQ